jgi:hypothetical protein
MLKTYWETITIFDTASQKSVKMKISRISNPKSMIFFVTYVGISGTSKEGITKLYTYVGKFPYNFLLQVFPAGMWKLEWKDEAYFFNHSQCGSNSENKVAEKSQSYLKTVYGFPTGTLWTCGVDE